MDYNKQLINFILEHDLMNNYLKLNKMVIQLFIFGNHN